MIFKERSESPFKKGLKFFIALEASMLITSYGIYAACNRSQKTRKYFHDRPYLNFVLEFYYKTGETFGTKTVRAYDKAVWDYQDGK